MIALFGTAVAAVSISAAYSAVVSMFNNDNE